MATLRVGNMKELLEESLFAIAEALDAGIDLREWLTFPDLDQLTNDHQTRSAALIESGYLQGAADQANMTVLELLDSHGIDPINWQA